MTTARALPIPGREPQLQEARPRWRLDVLDTFVLIQYLSMGLLFLPGAQAVRIPIRTLPYLASLGVALWLRRKPSAARRPPGQTLLMLVMLLLVFGLLHPGTQPYAGLAQVLLQLCIAAPMFGVSRAVDSGQRLDRLLWLVFASNAAGAIVGLLQVQYPDTFLPPEFSNAAIAYNPSVIEALSYTGTSGQRIIRPPGLSDLPGGAGVAGALTALLGIARLTRPNEPTSYRIMYLALSAIGLTTLFFTQIRSLLLVTIAALLVFGVLSARRGRAGTLVVSMSVGAAVLIGAFTYAVSVGGDAVRDRFLGIVEQGVVDSYATNRGSFLQDALTKEWIQYPFGAGVGRWGNMYQYFGDENLVGRQLIWAEIQLTGWLLDGGVLMWLLYGGAILISMRFAYVIATRMKDAALSHDAAVIFACLFVISAQSFAGPTFNTQLGLQYWTLVASLYGAAVATSSAALRRVTP